MRNFWLSLDLFVQAGRLSYIATFRWLRPATYLASKILMPVATILFFTLLGIYANGRDSASFYIVGNAMQMAAINGIYGLTMSIGGDRWMGTLPYLFGVPGNRLMFFLGRALFHVIDGSTGVVFGLLFGALLGLDFGQTNFGALALAILMATISTSGLGLLLGSLSLVTVNVFFVNNVFYFLLLVFSGANVPLESLPGWARVVSFFFPLTRSIEAARASMAGATLTEVLPLLGGELVVGVVYALLGYVAFRQFEVWARRRGTLEAF